MLYRKTKHGFSSPSPNLLKFLLYASLSTKPINPNHINTINPKTQVSTNTLSSSSNINYAKPRRRTTETKPTISSLSLVDLEREILLSIPVSPTIDFGYNNKPNKVSNFVSSSFNVDRICSLLACPTKKKLSVENLLRNYEHDLNSELVLNIVKNHKQIGRLRTMEFFTWSGLKMGFDFEDAVIEFMAEFMCRKSLFDDVKCFLLAVKSHGGRITCRTIVIVIRFLGKKGKFEEALCLFEEMGLRFGCEPDNSVFNELLYALCELDGSQRSIEISLEIFRRMKSPDENSYGHVMIGLCNVFMLEEALRIFGEMRRANIVPTETILNLLIANLCELSSREAPVKRLEVKNTEKLYEIVLVNLSSSKKSNATEPALRIFREVRKSGSLPSTFVVAKLLKELCNVGKINEAMEVLEVIERENLICRDDSYAVVIETMCDHQLVEQVSSLFQKLLKLKRNMKIEVYNSIISMLVKMNNLDDAMRVFKIMNMNRCVGNYSMYTQLISGFVEAENLNSAYELSIEMLGFGLNPSCETYESVVELIKREKRMDLFHRLEKRKESQALQRLCKRGYVREAQRKLEWMIEKRIYPAVYVMDSFKHAFELAGKSNLGRDLVERVRKVESAQIVDKEKMRLENPPSECSYMIDIRV